DTYNNASRFVEQVNSSRLGSVVRRNVVVPSSEKLALYQSQIAARDAAAGASGQNSSNTSNDTSVSTDAEQTSLVMNPFYLHDPQLEKNDPTLSYDEFEAQILDSTSLGIDNEEYQHTLFFDAIQEDRMHQQLVDRLGRLNVRGFQQFSHLDYKSALHFN
ncbi:unnamed protein product, partial [Amoebophrya sp. A25]